ncbi:hypothetical protein ACGFZS_06200 [Streptomyces sp. NPDC048288]|uniref:hypothetical protein n=1 Tax=Streptomyces sp. NPDC048288 TaxID=3365529 RepID=UPI003722B10A
MELSPRALSDLPGVRRQVGRIAADLAAGLHCLWLLPDDLVAAGYGAELHHTALNSSSERLDLPAFVDSEEAVARLPAPAPISWLTDDLPVLEDYDNGFTIDWEPDIPRQRGRPPRSAPLPEPVGSDLLGRLAKELSVTPGTVIDSLTEPGRPWRPVIGIRAWEEPEPTGGPSEPEGERGREIARLIRSLSAAVKQAGLLPEDRPRLLVTARVGDLPQQLPDELELDLASSAVHWWWGTLDRLDSATVVASVAMTSGQDTHRYGERLRDRILRSVRDEVVSEVCGPDPVLGWRLSRCWDGNVRTLEDSLRACLVGRLPGAQGQTVVHPGLGSGYRPAARLRPAWARGLLQSWDGRARAHPAVWCAEVRDPEELGVLVSQAQARILLPWIEDVRRRLALRALAGRTGPVADLVARYVERAPAGYRTRPEEAFQRIEVGPMLSACRQGHLNLPREDRQLLERLVLARNVLSHRGVLFDRTLRTLCDELAGFDERWSDEN